MSEELLTHLTGQEISRELDLNTRRLIFTMKDYQESKQLPILTEKILLLKLSIDKFNAESSRYSKIMVWLTTIMALAVGIQIYLLIVG